MSDGPVVVLRSAALVAFVASRDLDVAHGFYGGVLGLELVERTEFANVYDSNGTLLRVTRVERLSAAPYTVLGWLVQDLAATVRALAGAGVACRRYAGLAQDDDGVWSAPSGARVAWIEDPDGNTLSLTQAPA